MAMAVEESNDNKMFVGNVLYNCTQEDFENQFKLLPGYVSSNLVIDTKTNKCKGYGYVTFDSTYNFNTAMKQDISIGDRKLRKNKYFTNLYTDLFVKGIPESVTKEQLNECFNNVYGDGTVIETFIYNKSGDYQTHHAKIKLASQDACSKAVNDKTIVCDNNILQIYRWKNLNPNKNNLNKKKIFFNPNFKNQNPNPNMGGGMQNYNQQIYINAYNAGVNSGIRQGYKMAKAI